MARLVALFDGVMIMRTLQLLKWQWRNWREQLKRGSLKWRFNVVGHLDTSYASLWDISNKPFICEEYRRIRAGLLNPKAIIDKLERYYQDKTVYFETGIFRQFEPYDCRKTIDQITDDALTWMVKTHLQKDSSAPRYISVGTGTSTPDRTDHQLDVEVERTHILNHGGHTDALGHMELYGLLFDFAQADIDCTESGLHTTNSKLNTSDIMICRNKYNPALNHDHDQNALGINVCIQHRAF